MMQAVLQPRPFVVSEAAPARPPPSSAEMLQVNQHAVALLQQQQFQQAGQLIKACLQEWQRHVASSPSDVCETEGTVSTRIHSIESMAGLPEQLLWSPDALFEFLPQAFLLSLTSSPHQPDEPHLVSAVLIYNLALTYHSFAVVSGAAHLRQLEPSRVGNTVRLLQKSARLYELVQEQLDMLSSHHHHLSVVALRFAALCNMGHCRSCLEQRTQAEACRHHLWNHRALFLSTNDDAVVSRLLRLLIQSGSGTAIHAAMA